MWNERARAGFRRILEKRIRRIRGLEIFSGLNMIGSVLNPKTLSPSLNCDAASLAENEDEMEESRETLIKADANACLTY